MSKRVHFVDFARSYAIFLALTDHSFNDFGIWSTYAFSEYPFIKLLTTSATPLFLFLFGMMLELIYLRRLKEKGLSAIKPKLFKRSFQCYLGFILTSIAGLIGGYLTLKSAFATTFFAANTHYGNILKIYSVLIILAIPLLLIRKKYGIWSLIALSIAIWCFYPIFNSIDINNGSINIFMSAMFGIGESGGPSVLHSISIVSIGMLSASFIDFKDKWKFPKYNAILLLILLTITGFILFITPWGEFLDKYFNNIYRDTNHPIYYSVALSLAVIHIIIFSALIPLGTKLKPWTKHLLLFGRNSLSAFTIANIILNLIFLRIENISFSFLAPLGFILIVYILIFIYERIDNKMKAKQLS
ncbi:OpgC domain-containing protein [Marivirga sp.]|uniref:OpgC domain-containing protein n=1 Tax=Marivirga sp. TaxID=2018662 RepID=UPI0025D507F5|nr:OpgC domain-containing protein [Marivirga sp.]